MTISVKKVFISSKSIPFVSMPANAGISFFKSSPTGELSYKVKKPHRPRKFKVYKAF